MTVKEKLVGLVGVNNFSDAPEVLAEYSRDFSLRAPGMPNYVVKPKDAQEVHEIVQFANVHKMPIVPTSSKVHCYGAAIPRQGGIVLDMSRMNKILEIDADNRFVRIEAGVTWGQLTQELRKKGFRIIMPLTPFAERSVVTDYLEREVTTNTDYDYGEPLQSMEVVWPTGEIFRMGSASVEGFPDSISRGGNPSGPGLDFYRFFQGAQGTMGIVTWAQFKIESIPKIDKVLFAPIDELGYAIDFLYRILPRRIGQECVLLNNCDLAALIAEQGSDDLERLQTTLPPWTLVLVISGLLRRPEEKIAYEENFLKQVLLNEYPSLHLTESLPGFPGLHTKTLQLLRNPWPAKEPYWKNRYRGACQNLFFITRPELASQFISLVEEMAPLYGYPVSDVGIYLQPIEHNRACHLEFHFSYDPSSDAEKELIRAMYLDIARALLGEGAFFTRPYGELAPMVYEKAAGYAMALKRVKRIFDPNNIMNPGTLCF
jgi:hypothetical protein